MKKKRIRCALIFYGKNVRYVHELGDVSISIDTDFDEIYNGCYGTKIKKFKANKQKQITITADVVKTSDFTKKGIKKFRREYS